jgi:hypothetical protein
MPLVKDVPILELLFARTRTAFRCIENAKTIEHRRLWIYRKRCYQEAMRYVKMAEGVEETHDEPVMDFSEEDLPCLRD